MLRLVCALLALSSAGCSLLKLTVLTGPGCCENAGESVAPVGPLEDRTVVRASLAVAPLPPLPPRPVLPPGVDVVVLAPMHADVRVACAVDERTAEERVTSESVEYGGVERVVLGGYALAAAAIGAAALYGALAPDDDTSAAERAAYGTVGGVLVVDGAVTAGLALLHPTERHTATWDRPGAWRPVSDRASEGACPSDLALDVDGVRVPIGADGVVSDLDALRVAGAAAAGAPIDVVTRERRAPLTFALSQSAAGTVGDARAELGPAVSGGATARAR